MNHKQLSPVSWSAHLHPVPAGASLVEWWCDCLWRSFKYLWDKKEHCLSMVTTCYNTQKKPSLLSRAAAAGDQGIAWRAEGTIYIQTSDAWSLSIKTAKRVTSVEDTRIPDSTQSRSVSLAFGFAPWQHPAPKTTWGSSSQLCKTKLVEILGNKSFLQKSTETHCFRDDSSYLGAPTTEAS